MRENGEKQLLKPNKRNTNETLKKRHRHECRIKFVWGSSETGDRDVTITAIIIIIIIT